MSRGITESIQLLLSYFRVIYEIQTHALCITNIRANQLHYYHHVVDLSRFELKLSEPKSLVLPLHHRSEKGRT